MPEPMDENLSNPHDQIEQTGQKREPLKDELHTGSCSKELLPDILSRLRITKFSCALEDMGVESTDDLAYLEDADLEKIGMGTIPRRKLLEASGRDWRIKNESKPDIQMQIQPKSPDEKAKPQLGLGHEEDQEEKGKKEEREAQEEQKEPREGEEEQKERENEKGMQEHEVGCKKVEDGNVLQEAAGINETGEEGAIVPAHPTQTDGELKQLLIQLHYRLEDFAAVNGLDGASRTLLSQLPARIALRTIGLLGRDNEFVMQGVRRASGALLWRSRAAALEEKHAVLSGKQVGQPYEDWPRLLEGFASVNNLGESTRDLLDGLGRYQALQVMGFTSNLRFLIPADGCDAEFEVCARVRMAREGSRLVPVVPRSSIMTPPLYRA